MHISTLIKSTWLCFFIGLMCIISSNQAFGQWSQTSGPQGGYTNSVERVGDQIWAATANGVYYSSNEGASWNQHPEFAFTYCTNIRCFNDTVLVLYRDYDFESPTVNTRRSLNGGASWDNPVSLTPPFQITTPEADSIIRINNNLYIFGNSFSNQVSHDFGQTWEPFSLPSYLKCIGKYGLLTGDFEYYYFNDKLNTSAYIPLLDLSIMGTILIDSTIIFTYYDLFNLEGTIIVTNDYGQTFETTLTLTDACTDFSRCYEYEGAIYVKFSGQVVKSLDKGQTWEPTTEAPVMNFGLSEYPWGAYYDYVRLADSTFLIAGYTGVRQSPEDLSTVLETNTGLKAVSINSLKVHNDILYAFSDYRSYSSMNGGESWVQIPDSFKTVVSSAFEGDSLFFLCLNEPDQYSNTNPFVLMSFDNGQTWIKKSTQQTASSLLVRSISYSNGKLYAGVGYNIWMSNNFGDTWVQMPLWDDMIGGTVNNNGEMLIWNDTLFVFSLAGQLARFNEGDQTWTNVGATTQTSLYSNHKFTTSEGVLFATSKGNFMYSTDGNNWIAPLDISANQPNSVVSKDGVWYGSFYDEGVFTSTDLGVTWNPLQNTVSFNAMGGMVFLHDVLFSASNHAGVWRRTGLLSNVSGNIYRDMNNNGVKDVEDYNLEGFIVSTSPNLFSAASDQNGNYILITDAIDDTLRVNLPSSILQSNPPYYLITGDTANQNFGVHIPAEIADLTIDFTNTNVFRPGFATNFTINVENVGSIVQSPVVRVVLDEHLSLVSSTPSVSSQNQDTLIWNLDPLDFWQSSQITIQTIADQAIPIGTEAYCYSSVAPIQNDVTTEDNVSTVVSDYVGSYDPNDKTCLKGDFFTPEQLENNEELEFVIRFQNTGTFQADNILVSDTLSSYLDISTLRLINSSHPVRLEVSGNNIVDLYFDNIFLPDSFANEPLSHGFVKLAVQCRPEIILGDAVTNTAYIYFDFNEPIITNTTTTLHGYPVILGEEYEAKVIHQQSIFVYPNPASELLNIDTRGISKETLFISIFDSKGACVRNQPCINEIESISLNGLSTGIYFGLIYTEKNQKTGQFKFIKE